MQTGRKILNLRHDRSISQQDLARACDITPSALSKIEAGINSPRANIIWRIAKNLGVTVEYLLDEHMPYPYRGYSYRQSLLAKNQNPDAKVRFEVTREEKAFLETLRESSSVIQEITYSLPEAPVETVRLVHFLLHHARVENPDPAFLAEFEKLLASGRIGENGESQSDGESARPPRRRRRAGSGRPALARKKGDGKPGRRKAAPETGNRG